MRPVFHAAFFVSCQKNRSIVAVPRCVLFFCLLNTSRVLNLFTAVLLHTYSKMPYINNRGEIQEGRRPLSFEWFKELICNFFAFIYLLFASLFGFGGGSQRNNTTNNKESTSYGGNQSGSSWRPPGGTGGGGGAPRYRNVRGLNQGGGGGSPSCPPMAGGGWGR